MKRVKRVLIGMICLPLILIVLWILYEAFGMAVNHISGNQQTKNLIQEIETGSSSVKIIDSYTKTGNTTGTSNHVDMLSVVVFTTEDPLDEIENKMARYYESKESGSIDFWIGDIKEFKSIKEERGFLYIDLNHLDVADPEGNGYILYMNTGAPFRDNIEGH